MRFLSRHFMAYLSGKEPVPQSGPLAPSVQGPQGQRCGVDVLKAQRGGPLSPRASGQRTDAHILPVSGLP